VAILQAIEHSTLWRRPICCLRAIISSDLQHVRATSCKGECWHLQIGLRGTRLTLNPLPLRSWREAVSQAAAQTDYIGGDEPYRICAKLVLKQHRTAFAIFRKETRVDYDRQAGRGIYSVRFGLVRIRLDQSATQLFTVSARDTEYTIALDDLRQAGNQITVRYSRTPLNTNIDGQRVPGQIEAKTLSFPLDEWKK
jgi:hypothetical protein